ncbi:TRM10, partial [Symbiodinium sp. KB8]
MLAPGGPVLREVVVWSKPHGLDYSSVRLRAGAGDGNRASGRPRLWSWLLGFWAASTKPLRSCYQRLRKAPMRRQRTAPQTPQPQVVKPAVARPPRRRSYPPLPPAPGKLSPSERRQWRREQRFEDMKKKRKAGRAEERRKAALRRKKARKELLSKMSEEEKRAYFFEERRKQVEMEESLERAFEQGRPRVVINCSFGDFMGDRENRSLAQQVKLVYTLLKRMRANFQLHLTSLDAQNPARAHLANSGLSGWKVHVHEESVWERFSSEDLVILSPDATECLETIDEDKIYVIGGLVDRRVQKKRTFDQAKDQDLQLRKLPLKEYGPKGLHPILNIDVVMQILIERHQGNEWSSIFESCLPRRLYRDARGGQRAEESKGGCVLSGVDVSNAQGDSMLDAGIVEFAKGNYLDEMRAWHFKHHVTYCVAPVVTNRTQGPVSG